MANPSLVHIGSKEKTVRTYLTFFRESILNSTPEHLSRMSEWLEQICAQGVIPEKDFEMPIPDSQNHETRKLVNLVEIFVAKTRHAGYTIDNHPLGSLSFSNETGKLAYDSHPTSLGMLTSDFK